MHSSTRRLLLKLGALAGAGAAIRWQLDPTSGVLFQANRALAAVQVPQNPLPGSSIRQFVEPLTTFVGRRVSGSSLQVEMLEFQQRILPDFMYDDLGGKFEGGSYVWGYAVGTSAAFSDKLQRPRPSYPGTTVEVRQGTPITIKYVNNLPQDPVLRKYLTIDRSIHWADPLKQGHVFTAGYDGPIPTVIHLHGAEDQSTSDGAPEAWFTNNGLHGPGYYSFSPTDPNAAIY